MRRFIIWVTLITLILVFLGAWTGLGLALAGPIRPGNLLFPIQYLAEQSGVLFIRSDTAKAQYYLDLLERRTSNLERRAGTKHEILALTYLNEELNQVGQALAGAPVEDLPALRSSMLETTHHIRIVLDLLTICPAESPDFFAAMQAKVSTLLAMLEDPNTAQSNFARLALLDSETPATAANIPVFGSGLSNQPQLNATQAVLFPPGSPGAVHDFFPLIGQHALLECTACHTNGQFANTPNQCQDCHLDQKPAGHFAGDCAACHTATAWNDIHFDHSAAGASNCTSCHSNLKPANHFDGQCSACHNTNAWRPANFNHSAAGATN